MEVLLKLGVDLLRRCEPRRHVPRPRLGVDADDLQAAVRLPPPLHLVGVHVGVHLLLVLRGLLLVAVDARRASSNKTVLGDGLRAILERPLVTTLATLQLE